MAFETKNFIIDLVKQLNLNNMDDATRARLTDLQKKGVATKDQKSWEPGKEPPKIDEIDTSVTPPVYKYNGNPAPGGPAPTTNDLEELYLKLVVILRDLAADSELSASDPVKSFLADFYGIGKAVEPYTAAPIPIAEANAIGAYIAANKVLLAAGLGISESDLDALAGTLTPAAPTYATNAKSLKTLDKFLVGLYNWNDNGGTRPIPGALPACLETGGAIDYGKLFAIRNTINTPVAPTPAQKSQLNSNINKLFGKLVSNEKLFEKVSSKDEDGKVSSWVSKGIEKSNYKSGDNALTPKYTDRSDMWDAAKEKIKDLYVDTLGKLEQKHKRHIYTTNARYIVAGLIGKGVKPTDGTIKILDTLDAINGGLPNPVQKQVKWIKDTLSKMKSTKFFNEALRDGDQMRQLVQEIIKAAVHEDPPKAEEAKVALEMLAVMRYTLTTSSVRDQLRKTEFKLLSDGNLSFNKNNKFMQSLTSALDKTIRFGMMTAFEVGNFAKNSIKQQGLKFGSGTQNLDERTTNSSDYADPDKQQLMEQLFAFWDFVNSSANTKDYNIFRRHSSAQKESDKPNAGDVNVNLTSGPVMLHHDTNQQRQFLEFMQNNNIGRAA
ncbi:MAG: hypothetical protein J6J82_00335 [Alphaproteobacteria bacterium]|nr:hypothetical protein [Alphaproteobacteria bacterium]